MEDTRLARLVVSKLSEPIPFKPLTNRNIWSFIGFRFVAACVAFAPPNLVILLTRLLSPAKSNATLPTVFILVMNPLKAVEICGRFLTDCVAFVLPSRLTLFTSDTSPFTSKVKLPAPFIPVIKSFILVFRNSKFCVASVTVARPSLDMALAMLEIPSEST